MAKIALVSRTFIEDSSYLEEALARVLCLENHEVCVFSSRYKPPSFEKTTFDSADQVIQVEKKSFRVLRLPLWLKLKSNVFPIGLKKAVQQFQADKIILVGISDFFAASLLSKPIRDVEMYALIGNNSGMENWQANKSFVSKLKTFIVQRLLKKHLYVKAIKNCKKIILYTPETKDIVGEICGEKHIPELQRKMLETSLGYDSSQYFYVQNERHSTETQENEPCLIHLSRIDASKKVQKIIEAVDQLHQRGQQLGLILAGFKEDEIKHYQQLVALCTNPSSFTLLPFQTTTESRALFNKADLAIYLTVGASLQQALACGTPLLLNKKKNVEHLIQSGINGFYIEKSLSLSIWENIQQSIKLDRQQIADQAKQRFSYQSLLKTYFDLS